MLFDSAGDVETGYAVSSLAQVYLRTGDPPAQRSRQAKLLRYSVGAKTSSRRSATSSSFSGGR